MGICFQCGLRLNDKKGEPAPGLARTYHGSPVRIHKRCSTWFDQEQRATGITAKERDVGRYEEQLPIRHDRFEEEE